MNEIVGAGLGRRIKERRVALNMTQSSLARKADIAKSYLSKLEATEGTSPSATILHQIAQALDTTMPTLLGVPDRPKATVDSRSLPPALTRAKARYRFADDEVALLHGIAYRGRRPQTEDDYFFLLMSIRRSVG